MWSRKDLINLTRTNFVWKRTSRHLELKTLVNAYQNVLVLEKFPECKSKHQKDERKRLFCNYLQKSLLFLKSKNVYKKSTIIKYSLDT